MSDLLEQIGITKDELINRIVDKALGITADYKQTGQESWSDIPLSDVVDRKIGEAIGNLVEQLKPMIKTRIDEIMQKEVEKVFTMPFQRLTRWGDKQGELTTIRDMIADTDKDYWSKKVNSRGEDDYSGTERAVFFANRVMTEVYNTELTNTVKQMAKEMKEKIPQTIAAEITKTVIGYIK
jgi:uncharacterized protein YajQ (UPF0234 family)